MEAFLTHLSYCDTLSEPHQVTIFTTGLGELLQTDVKLQQPDTLEDAMSLTRAYEWNTLVAAPPITAMAPRLASRSSNCRMTLTQRPAMTTTPDMPIKPHAPPGTWLSRLTLEEMAWSREERLCFNYLEKFSRDDLKQCTMKGIYLLEMDSDDTMEGTFVDDTGAQISLNTLIGVTNTETMRLPLTLAKQDINAWWTLAPLTASSPTELRSASAFISVQRKT
jgi:hypothetical protein